MDDTDGASAKEKKILPNSHRNDRKSPTEKKREQKFDG